MFLRDFTTATDVMKFYKMTKATELKYYAVDIRNNY